jgi:hypothetical protein
VLEEASTRSRGWLGVEPFAVLGMIVALGLSFLVIGYAWGSRVRIRDARAAEQLLADPPDLAELNRAPSRLDSTGRIHKPGPPQ